MRSNSGSMLEGRPHSNVVSLSRQKMDHHRRLRRLSVCGGLEGAVVLGWPLFMACRASGLCKPRDMAMRTAWPVICHDWPSFE
jgi:hypothetical protein